MDAALEQLVDGPPVHVAALARVRSCDDAALQAQEFKPFLLWLRGCAKGELFRLRQAAGEGSKRAPRPAEPRLLAEPAAARLAEKLLSVDSATMGWLLKNELRRRLAAVLANLGRFDRELLMLRHLDGLSMAECAVVLGISEEAVKVRYMEVLERLRVVLTNPDHF